MHYLFFSVICVLSYFLHLFFLDSNSVLKSDHTLFSLTYVIVFTLKTILFGCLERLYVLMGSHQVLLLLFIVGACPVVLLSGEPSLIILHCLPSFICLVPLRCGALLGSFAYSGFC